MNVEQRIQELEREVNRLKLQMNTIQPSNSDKSNWISQMAGQFHNDPVFDEIAQIGKELRDSEEPDYGDDETE